jgi:hypothetical protein
VTVIQVGKFTFRFFNNTPGDLNLYDGPDFVSKPDFVSILRTSELSEPFTFFNELIIIIDKMNIGYFYRVDDGKYLGCGPVNVTTTSTTSTSASTSSTSTTSSSTTTTTTQPSLSQEGPGGPIGPGDPELPIEP